MDRTRLVLGTLALLFCGSARGGTKLFTFQGDGAYDYLGDSVAAAGDVDQDGFADVVVGAPGPPGYVRVFSGKNGALVREWAVANSYHAVDGAGDVNQDGHADIVVGDGASVAVYSGKTGALLYQFADSAAGLGGAVAGAGDVNHDGYADFLAGARWGSTGGKQANGYVRLYSGKTGAVLYQWNGPSNDDRLGWSVDGAGDLNGDGFLDVVATAPHYDDHGVILGMVQAYSGKDGTLLYTLVGSGDYYWGWEVSGGSDIDKDGFADFVVSAPWDTYGGGNAGRVWAFSGVNHTVLYKWAGGTGDHLGTSATCAGDVNGDGYGDVIVGAPDDSAFLLYDGTVRVYSGKDGTTLVTYHGAWGSDSFGSAVSGAGDVNHDGHADLVVGQLMDDASGTDAGKAIVYSGQDYVASWSNYDKGWPGTKGVPSFTASQSPVICSSITLDIANSRGATTAGTLFIGLAAGDLPTAWGGRILVLPPWTLVSLVVPTAGLSLPVDVLCDSSYLGLKVYLQVLESDPGASAGVAFTPGLLLVHGL
ncbi:MAG: FG-GAP-like repeat-containing protein [Planctomycetota bacterium]